MQATHTCITDPTFDKIFHFFGAYFYLEKKKNWVDGDAFYAMNLTD